MATVKQLSCQSSVEPCCVLEEEIIDVSKETRAVIESTAEITHNGASKTRPESLILNTATVESSVDAKKFLYRSQSTRSFRKPKLKPSKLLSSDLDQIYVISSTRDDFYDSIEVISERRNKNFMAENKSESDGACDNGNNDEIRKETVVDIES